MRESSSLFFAANSRRLITPRRRRSSSWLSCSATVGSLTTRRDLARGGTDVDAARPRYACPRDRISPLERGSGGLPAGLAQGVGFAGGATGQRGLSGGRRRHRPWRWLTRRDISFWILVGRGTSTRTSWPARPADSINMSPQRSSRSDRVCLYVMSDSRSSMISRPDRLEDPFSQDEPLVGDHERSASPNGGTVHQP